MSIGTSALPLPRWEDATVVVEPPGDEPGAWAGAPSSIVVDDAVYGGESRVTNTGPDSPIVIDLT